MCVIETGWSRKRDGWYGLTRKNGLRKVGFLTKGIFVRKSNAEKTVQVKPIKSFLEYPRYSAGAGRVF